MKKTLLTVAFLLIVKISIGQNTYPFPASGNVGIGTANPLNGLHVFSYDDFGKGSIRIGYSGAEDAVISFGWNGTNQDAFRITKFSHNSTTNGTNLFTISSNNGNVGIGTINPDAKLAVNGTIHAKEIKVDLNVPGADYVFENKYPLKPLVAINKYITQNHHLPGIPSAKSMEKNGIDLSTMNTQLLQKVEELTLYLIQQEKSIRQLEANQKKH